MDIESAVVALTDLEVTSVGSMVAREQLIGEIRCMKRLKELLEDSAKELEVEILSQTNKDHA